MNIKNIVLSTVVFVTLVGLLGNCKKYPEGPSLSLASKKGRMANDWIADKVIINDIDSSAYSKIIGSTISLTKDGKVTGTFYEENGDTIIVNTGEWLFSDEKDQMGVIYTDANTAIKDTVIWIIDRLKQKELWVHEEDNKIPYIKQIQFKQQ